MTNTTILTPTDVGLITHALAVARGTLGDLKHNATPDTMAVLGTLTADMKALGDKLKAAPKVAVTGGA